MAWESRNGGGLYYTRSRRVNGRVRREYVGTGLAGAVAAAEDRVARQERETVRRAARQAIRRGQAVEGIVAQAYAAAEGTLRVSLVTAGYHRHARGEWRKRRGCPGEA